MTDFINKDNSSFVNGVWSEKVLIITKEFEIKGYIFMPKTAKRSRVLSDILNGNRRFIAVKDCAISTRTSNIKRNEYQDFIQVNVNEIVLLRPITEEKENQL